MNKRLPAIAMSEISEHKQSKNGKCNKGDNIPFEHSFATQLRGRGIQPSKFSFKLRCFSIERFVFAIRCLHDVALFFTSVDIRVIYEKIKRAAVLIVVLYCLTIQNSYAKKCTGEFVNPISDICWSCLFPITIGKFEIIGSDTLADTGNPSSPVCICPKRIAGVMVPSPGITGGFWEPARLVDVSAEPYCFVNMGGLEIDLGFERSQGGRPKASSHKISRWYVHYYIYPILYLLELFTDFICLDETSFDPLWISEIDPTGMDDELSMILHPEGFLFNNLLAQSACSADCLSSSLNKGKPADSLYWCAGCQGSMFPMNGNINAHTGGVQASVNAAEKMTFKMHRQLMAHETASENVREICSKRLAPIMKKSHYRYQMVNPNSDKCYPFGKTTTVFEAKKETPVVGEDFGYLIWRKRQCCIL